MALDFVGFRKGQISMEFILLVIVMLLYLQTVIQPLGDASVNSVDDVTRLSQAKLSAEKLVSVADYISAQSNESKFSTLLVVPKDANISCDTAGTVTFSVLLNEQITNINCTALGQASLCTKDISLLNSGVICQLPKIVGPTSLVVAVVKDDTGAVAIVPQ